ncbi:sensor histidine kinase [Algoriphagus sp. A40]|uniref:sensor histidine kinase n=1 Tax=Algoriphagus sp. A40 TaxID=1945863 RepID=UPI000985D7C1|nr:histidine kinase [Algoriphagus sp. A40]OOG73815.1 hypothetical protein B0E43_13315 [Algoriphagus sp. A40]
MGDISHFLNLLQVETHAVSVTIPEQPLDTQIRTAVLFGLLPVILAFSFIVFVIYRSKRETAFKQRETQLKLSVVQGELKALKAQINPHFIFNCLNSIHHYIQTQDSYLAGTYLIKFSQLVRYVLESSSRKMVDLQEEMENCKIYLELERMRVNGAFDFHFTLEDSLLGREIQIPPMFIQPFLENAVWHGLAEGGQLSISFAIHDPDHLCCLITDDGKEKTEKSSFDLAHKVKKTSMGIQLMKERFDFYNELNKTKAEFSIHKNPANDRGSEVRLLIPFED